MNLVGTQPIQTERLLLRRYTMEDVEAMYTGWASDSQVEPFVQWPLHANRDVTREVL